MKVAKDISRVLRIPGYYHMKNPQDRFLVKLIDIDPTLTYTEQQMLEAFPNNDFPEQEDSPKIQHNKYNPEEHGFFGLLSTWDSERMLLELSGKSIIN